MTSPRKLRANFGPGHARPARRVTFAGTLSPALVQLARRLQGLKVTVIPHPPWTKITPGSTHVPAGFFLDLEDSPQDFTR